MIKKSFLFKIEMEINTSQIFFKEHEDFRPNLTPEQMFKLGIFGGSYFRPIHSDVTGEDYSDQWKEFDWAIKMVEENPDNIKLLASSKAYASLNACKVLAGSSLIDWQKSGWIIEDDPYGWVQWYCRFYSGKRSNDDARQIKRWLNFTGPKGRFKNQLVNKLKAAKTSYNDLSISPVIRQGLLQWAYALTPDDLK